MNVNRRECFQQDLTYRIAGCAMAVLNEIGHGLREKTYERALCVEFSHQGIQYAQQRIYPVFYRGIHVDDYIPDLEVEGHIIVEIKTVEQIANEHIGQVLNYLRITKHTEGIILNFKHTKLEWRKVTLKH